jgi:hypothetical protein
MQQSIRQRLNNASRKEPLAWRIMRNYRIWAIAVLLLGALAWYFFFASPSQIIRLPESQVPAVSGQPKTAETTAPAIPESVKPEGADRFSSQNTARIRTALIAAFAPSDPLAKAAIRHIADSEGSRDQNDVWIRAAVTKYIGSEYRFWYLHFSKEKVENQYVAYVCGAGQKRYLIFQLFNINPSFDYSRLSVPGQTAIRLYVPPDLPRDVPAVRFPEGSRLFVTDDPGPIPQSVSIGGQTRKSAIFVLDLIEGSPIPRKVLATFEFDDAMIMREELCRIQRDG